MHRFALFLLLALGTAPALAEEPPVNLEPIPAEAYTKLSSEELKALIIERQNAIVKIEKIRNHADEPNSKIAILVPLGFFGSIVLGLFATLLFRMRREQFLHKTLALMVEKGAQIPPELLTGTQRKPNDLRRGLLLVLGGTAGSLMALATEGAKGGAWSVGLIPMFIGVGYLLTWAIERRQAQNDAPVLNRVMDLPR